MVAISWLALPTRPYTRKMWGVDASELGLPLAAYRYPFASIA